MQKISRKIGRSQIDAIEFASLSEWADCCKTAFARDDLLASKDRQDIGWFGGKTARQTLECARSGDLSLVADTDRLLGEFETVEYLTPRRAWLDDVTGAFPNVPAYIAGIPTNMRRRVRRGDAFAPIRLFVDVFASSRYTQAQVRARGAAVLALVRVLAMRRPVELYVGCCSLNRDTGAFLTVYTRLETAPLDLATAAFALVHPAFVRRMCFAALREGLGASRSVPHVEDEQPSEKVAALLGGDDFAFVPGLVSSNDLACTDPQRWIAEQIKAMLPGELAA